ncbi:MAG TPA: TerB family tellurite resistance protein [Parafilimonas sp.]|nr:TerB family tellurite resistance protein [Parafilimonas sp.]
MKRLIVVLLISVFAFTISNRVKAQSFEIQQLILDCEKLVQLKDIYEDLVTGYDILSDGYNAVRDISKGNFDLHDIFLDGLMKVSPVVQQYSKVAGIIDYELKIVSEYSVAFERFKADNNFSPDEIIYIAKVYDKLLDESIKGVSDLTNVITDGILRASDDERLSRIDALFNDMQDRLTFLRHFNNNTSVLSLQRARSKNDLNTVGGIYGIKK